MSVFRKYTPGAGAGGFQRKSSLPGTKSWVYGQSLLSTGCSDLDNACGTGIPLGSIMVVSEEMGIHQAGVLGRLFVAEGLHSKQRVLVISSRSREAVAAFLSKLPSIRGREGGSERVVNGLGVNGLVVNNTSGSGVNNTSGSHTTNTSGSHTTHTSSPNTNTQPSQPTAKPRAWQYGKYLSHTSKTICPLPRRSGGGHSLLPLLRPQPERNQRRPARQRRLSLRR